ncbi:MAG: caspase family protein, partial [Desulfomonilaceae bacterium]
MKIQSFQIIDRGANYSMSNILQVAAFLTAIFIIWPTLTVSGANTDFSKIELYAVSVGVGKYRDPRLKQLELSPKDAQDFNAFLQERKHLFSKTHIKLFLNEQATRENVTKAIRDDLRPARKDDIVVVYISGHGTTDPVRSDEYYFLTYDADPENLFGSALLMNSSGL